MYASSACVYMCLHVWGGAPGEIQYSHEAWHFWRASWGLCSVHSGFKTKCCIASLPSVSADEEAVSLKVKCLLYSCLLAAPLPSGSRVHNKLSQGGWRGSGLLIYFFHLIFHFSPCATIGCTQKLYQCNTIRPEAESILVELKEDMGVAYALIRPFSCLLELKIPPKIATHCVCAEDLHCAELFSLTCFFNLS